MILSSLGYKISFLKKELSFSKRIELETKTTEIIYKHCEKTSLSKTIKNYLILDLMFQVSKHFLWSQHPYFKDILLQNMMEQFKLERLVCEKIITPLLELIKILRPPPNESIFKKGEKNFLLYAVVLTLESHKQEDLIDEIGLGDSILRQINQANQYFSDFTSKRNEQVYFSNDRDAGIYKVIENLSKSCQHKPWSIDLYQLFYILADSPAPWQNYFCKNFCASISNFLIKIGLHASIDIDTCIKDLEEEINKNKDYIFSKKDFKNLLSFLEQKNLIYSVISYPKNSKKRPSTNFFLSEKGAQLSAQAFSYGYGENSYQNLHKDIKNFPAAWQSKLLIKLADIDIDELILILSNERLLSPEALEQGLKMLKDEISLERVFEIITRVLQRPALAESRAIICKVLGNLNENSLSIDILEKLNSSDPSNLVKDAALEQLYFLKAHSQIKQDESQKYS